MDSPLAPDMEYPGTPPELRWMRQSSADILAAAAQEETEPVTPADVAADLRELVESLDLVDTNGDPMFLLEPLVGRIKSVAMACESGRVSADDAKVYKDFLARRHAMVLRGIKTCTSRIARAQLVAERHALETVITKFA